MSTEATTAQVVESKAEAPPVDTSTAANDILAKGPPPPEPRTYAGKYKGEDALRAGVDESRKLLGLDPHKDRLSTDHLEREYLDNSKLIGRLGAPKTEPPKTETNVDAPTSKTDIDLNKSSPKVEVSDPRAFARETIKKAGLDEAKVVAEFESTGKLSPDSLAKIKEALPGRTAAEIEVFANHLRGMQSNEQAAALAVKADAVKIAGVTEQQFDGMLRDARAFVPEDAFDDLAERLADTKLYKRATAELKQHWEAKYGDGRNPVPASAPGGGVAEINIDNFDEIGRAALAGDPAAIARIKNTPMTAFNGLSRKK